jgi:mRNA-degrading endonuclease RelE of RelBE toxin-antitoxin system
MGLFHHNILRCTKCGIETPLTNFRIIHPIESTQQEPNKHLILACGTTGVGYRAAKSIMSMLSLSIQSERTFLKHLHKLYDDIYSYSQAYFKSIIEQIKRRSNTQENIVDITVSIDGTWKRRGHVSNYGIVFVIDVDSGLCIDFEVMSLFCEACTKRRSILSETKFKKWFKKHQQFCNRNYDGTSKSMEREGVIKLFQRSLINGLRYKHMVCDGDASAFEAIKNYYIQQQQQQQRTSSNKGKLILINEHDNMNCNKLTGTEDEEAEDEAEDEKGKEEEGEDQEGKEEEGEPSEGEEGEPSEGEEGEPSENEEGEEDGEPSEDEEEGELSEDDQEEGEPSEDEDAGELSEDGEEESELSDDEESEDEEPDSGDIFNKLVVEKEDCINHVGKRVMKYLIELKKEKTRQIPVTTSSCLSSTTNKKVAVRQLLADNKPWGGGAGRMTNQMMKKLSNSYGLAIRQGSMLSSGKKYSK